MLSSKDITDFINQNIYDIRITKNGRWIDQKCAADVLTVIADCIYNYILNNSDNTTFTTADIWYSDYAKNNVVEIFKKPDVDSELAQNEYDKFFQQPMELLAASKVLNKTKNGNRNIYSVADIDILEFIALREKNSLFFLKEYITKTLKDSGIYYLFETFFNSQTPINYSKMKKGFSDFTIGNTAINGVVECNRIFIKVLNPLAYYNNALGTERGHLSRHNITYDMLMYNRNNFRDINAEKPKEITRKEYMQLQKIVVNDAYYRYQSTKAKHYLKLFNDQYRDNKSEHFDEFDNGTATQIHHIFPESQYPEICYYLENLIALTPTQHMTKAHPNNNTREICETYQHLLLLSKTDRIKENLSDATVEKIYEFSKLLHVLNVGFDDDNILKIEDMDFDDVVNAINLHYAA